MVALPRRLYAVRRSGGKFHYLSPSGKYYADLEAALGRVKAIERDGAKGAIYYTDVEWKELEVQDGVLSRHRRQG